jgi:predicted nuclease of predicted toxin-antitoxin system
VKFLVDNQLPAALARFLALRDAEIWEHASRHDCVVISKDADFLYLANAPGAKAGSPRASSQT